MFGFIFLLLPFEGLYFDFFVGLILFFFFCLIAYPPQRSCLQLHRGGGRGAGATENLRDNYRRTRKGHKSNIKRKSKSKCKQNGKWMSKNKSKRKSRSRRWAGAGAGTGAGAGALKITAIFSWQRTLETSSTTANLPHHEFRLKRIHSFTKELSCQIAIATIYKYNYFFLR